MRSVAPFLLIAVVACADGPVADDPEEGSLNGTSYDEEHPDEALFDDKSDAPRYAIPTDLPTLVAPEIIVSMDGLTVHLFDRESGFQAVYPAGVGIKVDDVSVTPVGHFATSDDLTDTWWYVARRNKPAYFGGFPFLRITAENANGANTYGLHGPITETLQRDYVSQGCIRMAADDVVDLFWMVKKHPSTPVTFQTEVERDAMGRVVDVGRLPALWTPGEEIEFGASVGTRPF
jgi:hypothetical protein